MHPFAFIQHHHRTGYRQRQPTTCGPSSLALAAASLGLPLRPETDWLAEPLSRWVPTQDFRLRGLSLQEAQFITEYLHRGELEVTFRRAFPENLAAFRDDLLTTAERGDHALVLNFAQDLMTGAELTGHGNPHFSPVAGFDPATDTLRIADVDPETTDIYGVTVKKAFEAMAAQNPAFHLPRGWLLLRKR
jgi:glutathione gamma-glutamylcysteinyltransferase